MLQFVVFPLTRQKLYYNIIIITLYQYIYTTGMGFSTYSTQNHQFKISPTAFFEQTAKYSQTSLIWAEWDPRVSIKQKYP